jgi:thiol-disulfide isomerase/thioredoxin
MARRMWHHAYRDIVANEGGTSRRLARGVGAVLAAALLFLAGCGRSADVSHAAATPGPLLAFTATTLDGAPFDGMSLAGKPTVLWFWAPWCPTCLQQAPGVRDAYARYHDKVNIVGVAGLDKTEAMPEFVRLAKLPAMTTIADEPGTVWKRFEVTAQSVFVFIDATGKVTFRGALASDDVPDRIAALLTA